MNRLPLSPLVNRAFETAEKHLGIDDLSKRLEAPATTIRAWRFGHVAMHDHMLLRLVDTRGRLRTTR
jgi:hypothetical protein